MTSKMTIVNFMSLPGHTMGQLAIDENEFDSFIKQLETIRDRPEQLGDVVHVE